MMMTEKVKKEKRRNIISLFIYILYIFLCTNAIHLVHFLMYNSYSYTCTCSALTPLETGPFSSCIEYFTVSISQILDAFIIKFSIYVYTSDLTERRTFH